MQTMDQIFFDPRFLEAVRLLLEHRQPKETSPASEETPGDEATRRVQAKILLRMNKRHAKNKAS